MGNRYSFTEDGLHNIDVYGVAPGEVWEALHSKKRVLRHLDDKAAAVFGTAHTGRHLVVFVLESDHEDNDWDIITAREMFSDEKATFNRYTGRN